MKMTLLKSVALSMMILISLAAMTSSQPLSTSSRWIVNESTGERVKLACLNWAAHLDAVVAEGLSKQPVAVISRTVRNLGFNCVRLTWPLYLMTDDSIASVTVRESFLKLGLTESVAGFQRNNPSLIDLSLIDAFQAVVADIASNDVMIVLDNHLSKPGWCCDNADGNGFLGDRYFEPEVWIRGLTRVAGMFNGVANVVGMSLRNELRGPKQNINDWYRYMQEGAEAVHAANPKALVILSGLSFDTDLSFLHRRALNLSFSQRLVFEVHWYSFTNRGEWDAGTANGACGRITHSFNSRAGFLLSRGTPLFLSEFGIDQRGESVVDNRYMNCLLGWAVENDVDFALWTLVGSYYLRDNRSEFDEYYGVYDQNWSHVRNASYLKWISVLQTTFQGPGSKLGQPKKLLFHTASGMCVNSLLELGPCSEAASWTYSSGKVLEIKGLGCLQAASLGNPAKFGLNCSDPSSKWDFISESKLHFASKLLDSTEVCLDVVSNVLVTNKCKCLSGDNKCDPESQWFKIIQLVN